MPRPNVARMWTLSRLATLLMLFAYEDSHGVIGDVNYFAQNLGAVADHGWGQTLAEYPLPAVAVLAVPWAVSALLGSTGLFPVLLLTGALATDAGFTLLLATRPSPDRLSAVVFWLLAVPLLGSIVLARFDLLTGVPVAVAVLIAHRRPRWASALLAMATAVKLWPVILLPSLLSATRRRGGVLAVLAGVGVVVVLGCLLVAGWGRLLSPLTYQMNRGLQIEAPLATPAMVGWLVDGSHWHIGMSVFRSVDVTGTGVEALVLTSTVLTVGLLVALGLLWRRAWHRPAPLGVEGLVWLSLTSVCGYLVTAKVFSPQYLLWLLPVTAVGLAVAPSPALRRWSACLLAVAGLSHLVYPLLYRSLVFHTDWSTLAVTLLVLRNLFVLALFCSAARRAWRLTSPWAEDVAAAPELAGDVRTT